MMPVAIGTLGRVPATRPSACKLRREWDREALARHFGFVLLPERALPTAHREPCRPHPAELLKRERLIAAESEGKAEVRDHPGWRWWLCQPCGEFHPGEPPLAETEEAP